MTGTEHSYAVPRPPAPEQPGGSGERPAVVLVTIVVAAWAAGVLYAGCRLAPADLLALAPIIVLTVFVQRLRLSLPAFEAAISLGVVGSLAAGMLYGIPGSVVVSSVVVLAGGPRRHGPAALLFNLGSVTLSNSAAAAVFLIMGQLLPGSGPVLQIPGALAAGAAAYLFSSALLALIVSLTRGEAPGATWVATCRWLLPYWMGHGVVALGLSLTYRATGVTGLLAFAGPALLMRYALKQYVDVTMHSAEELRVRNEALLRANAALRDETAERREAEAALRRSEQRFRALVQNSSDIITIVDADGCTTYTSPAAERILGYPPREVIGVSTAASIHPDDAAALRAMFADLLDHPGASATREVRRRHRDGSWRTMESIFTNLLGDPTVRGIVENSRDVTERRRAAQDLRESEARKGAILDAAMDCIVTIDWEGRVVEFNPAAERTFGYRRGEAIGRDLADLIIPPSVRERHRRGLMLHLVTGGGTMIGRRVETTALRADGSEFPIELSASRMPTPGPPMFTGFMRDITARREAEAAVRLAKEEAERANQAKTEFLSRMSHELRTPLHVMLGFAELLEPDPAAPEGRESLDMILNAGRHLLNLINEVLDIARVETGRIDMALEAVALEDVLDESLHLIQPLAASRDVRLIAGPALGCGVCIVADRQRLKQVLLNLLSNAVKYNRDGGAVTVTAGPAAPGRVRLCVSDTGYGISLDRRDRLFTPFDRLGAERGAVEGTGLGLAVSKSLVEAMGGAIGCESVEGEGTTFWVDLPAGRSERDDSRDEEGAVIEAAG